MATVLRALAPTDTTSPATGTAAGTVEAHQPPDHVAIVVAETSLDDGGGDGAGANGGSSSGGGVGSRAVTAARVDPDSVSNESAAGFGDLQSDDDDQGCGASALEAAARRSVSTPVMRHCPADAGSNDSLERIPVARPSNGRLGSRSRSASTEGEGSDDEVGNDDEYILVAGENEHTHIPGQVARTVL